MQANSIKFIEAANELHAAIEKMHGVVKEIQAEPDLGNFIDEVSLSGNPITVLEPSMLQVTIKQLMDDCYILCLVDKVRKKDPHRQLTDEQGRSWYQLAIGNQSNDLFVASIVDAIRATREALGSYTVDVKDAKTIVELARAGLI